MMPELGPAQIAAALAEARASAYQARTDEQSPVTGLLRSALAEVQATREVSYHWPLTPRRLLDRPQLLFDRLVRRYLRWYIGRLVVQQNAANEAFERALELLAERYAEIRDTDTVSERAGGKDLKVP